MSLKTFISKLATLPKPIKPFLSIFTSKWNARDESEIHKLLDSAIRAASTSDLFFRVFSQLQLGAYNTVLKSLSAIIYKAITELSKNHHGFDASKIIVHKWTITQFGKSFKFCIKNLSKSSGYDTELVLCVPIEFLVQTFYSHIFRYFKILLESFTNFSTAYKSIESKGLADVNAHFKKPSKAQLPLLFKSLSQSTLLIESQRSDSQIRGILHIRLRPFFWVSSPGPITSQSLLTDNVQAN